jgi:hypothetical protein
MFGRGGGGDGGVGLLADANVQKELKLTDEERANVELVRKEIEDSGREFFGKMRDMSREEIGEKMRERRKEVEKMIAEVLGDKSKRFKQVQLQVGGVMAAAMNPDNKDAMKITDEQIEKLRETMRDSFQGMQGLGPDADPAEREKTMKEMRKKNEEATLALLTDEQKKIWKEMIGEPITFEVKMPQFGGGRFGGGKGRPPGGEGDQGGGRKRKGGKGGNKGEPPPAV